MDTKLLDKFDYIKDLVEEIELQFRSEETKANKEMSPSSNMILSLNGALSNLETIYFALKSESIIYEEYRKEGEKFLKYQKDKNNEANEGFR